MGIDRLSKTVILSAALVFAGAADTVALAQTEASPAQKPTDAQDGDADNLQEVTVTANRREERIHDVPVSVAAATGAMLQEVDVRRPEDLVRLFPGFTAITNAGSAAVSYNIRGVGQSDFSEHEEQPVAAYQDGVYIANSAATGFPLFDNQRVELLRGPQGTLFGRNATGGLVQFISNQPTAGTSGYASVSTGSFDLRRAEGAINVGNDTLAVRLAGYFSDRDGFVKNTLGENLLAEEVGAVRLQVRYAPSAATTATLRFEEFNSDGTSENKATPSAVGPNGIPYLLPANVNAYGTGPGADLYGYRDTSNPYVESVNDPGEISKRSRTVAQTISHKMSDDLTLSSITSFNQADEAYREDTDGTPNYVFFNMDRTHTYSESQEVRIQETTTNFRGTGGLYLLNIDGTYFIENGIPTICDPTDSITCVYAGNPPLDGVNGKGAVAASDYRLRTKSAAVFMQGEYDFTEHVTGILGVRYTKDWQKFDYQFFCTQTEAGACTAIFGTGIPTSVKYQGPLHLTQSDGLPSGKVGLNYKVSADILTYVSVNRGVKGAGYIYSYDGTLPASQLSFRPEKLTSYEGGVKTNLLENMLSANLAVFHYDYHDFQTFQFSGVSATVVNKGATANGGELELNASPGHGVSANLGVAYDNFWVKDIPTFNGLVEDQRPINAPVWQLNWGLAKQFRLPGDVTFRAAYDGRYTGERWFNIVNEPVVRSPSDIIHNADIAVTTGNGVSYRAYVTNFTNVAVANARFDQTAQGFVLTHYSPPRAFGVAVQYDFQ
jgi:iron complex outermembrane recepter protein